MAIKTIIYPPLVAVSGNEVLLRITITNAYKSKGANQKGFIYFMSFHEAGDTITFSWNGKIIVFTCVSSYTGEPMTYPMRTGAETINEWGEKVFRIFASNYELINDFMILGMPQLYMYTITFEPYIKEAYNNLSIIANIIGAIVTVNSNFTPDELYINYCLQLQLMEEILFETVTKISKSRSAVFIPFIYAGYNATLQYDLKRLIYSDITGHFTFPEDNIRHIHNAIKKYYLQLSFIADNITGESLPADHHFYVLPGKISQSKEKALNSKLSNIYAELASSKRFLSYAPLIKKTDIYAPEKLYFLFLGAYPTATLKITERFTNSTSQTRDLATFDAKAYSLHEFSVGFQTIKQPDYGGLILREYEIWIENGSGGLVSEKRTFRMDYSYQRTARYFLFKNSFGMYELFRSTGDAEKINKIDKEFYDRVIHGKKDLDQMRKPIEIKQSYAMKVNSGYLEDPFNFYYSSEFLGSSDVYWLKNDRAFAVQVEGSDVTVSKTDLDNLHEFDFQIFLDDMDDSFFEEFLSGSELPVLGDFNNDFSDDFNV